ncbi:MAG TPA: DUF1203 domain-containing protein [Allosphingosinicella sp.]
MSFRLAGLSAEPFRPLYGLSDAELEARGVRRLIADDSAPCRVTLENVRAGEPVLLLTFDHLEGPSLYRGSGPIFVGEGAVETCVTDRIPDNFRARIYSARAYDSDDTMIDADVAPGTELEGLIERMFADPAVAYIHLHHAKRGCFSCRVDRG